MIAILAIEHDNSLMPMIRIEGSTIQQRQDRGTHEKLSYQSKKGDKAEEMNSRSCIDAIVVLWLFCG
jgi:hypothetical protein